MSWLDDRTSSPELGTFWAELSDALSSINSINDIKTAAFQHQRNDSSINISIRTQKPSTSTQSGHMYGTICLQLADEASSSPEILLAGL